MDVAILGTGERARQFARLLVTDERDQTVDSEIGPSTIALYGDDATVVMDTIDGIEEDLRTNGVPEPSKKADQIDRTTDLERAVDGATVVVETRTKTLETLRNHVADVERNVDGKTTIAFPAGEAGATAVAVALEQPARGIALRPVAQAEPGVLEIIRADQTSDTAVESAKHLAAAIGWRSVVVNDAPGEISQRLQLALELEAMRAVETDVATPVDVDAMMEAGFGYEEGPLASADRAGLDERLETLERLAEELGDRFDPPAVLQAKVDAGELGQKTGQGFHTWEDGKPVVDDIEDQRR